MPDQTYIYYGPLSAVSLAADKDHPQGRNVQLARGLTVTLPDDNDYVKSLVARKYLVPVAVPESASPAESGALPSAAEVKPAASPAATAATLSTVGTKSAEADKTTPAASVVASASSPAVAAGSAKDGNTAASSATETTPTGV